MSINPGLFRQSLKLHLPDCQVSEVLKVVEEALTGVQARLLGAALEKEVRQHALP